MENTAILITGAGGGGLGEAFLQSVRMAKKKYRIITADMNPVSIGLFEGDKGYIVPSASDSAYIPRLLEICKKENIKAILPGSEPEIMKLSESRKLFSEQGVTLLINEPNVIDICLDKWKTYEFLKKNGFPTPESIIIRNVDEIHWAGKYPVILKPYTGTGGSRHTYIAQDEDDLRVFCKFMLKYNVVPIVQQYVGDMDEEYTVGVLTTLDKGEFVGSIALKRNIQSSMSNRMKLKSKLSDKPLGISTGISQGEIGDYPEVLRNAEKIAKALGSKGSINVQCRKQGDTVYTFEINPRFSGSMPIRAVVGFNEVDITLRHSLFGEKIEPVNYKKGYVMRGLRNVFIDYKDVDRFLEGKI